MCFGGRTLFVVPIDKFISLSMREVQTDRTHRHNLMES